MRFAFKVFYRTDRSRKEGKFQYKLVRARNHIEACEKFMQKYPHLPTPLYAV